MVDALRLRPSTQLFSFMSCSRPHASARPRAPRRQLLQAAQLLLNDGEALAPALGVRVLVLVPQPPERRYILLVVCIHKLVLVWAGQHAQGKSGSSALSPTQRPRHDRPCAAAAAEDAAAQRQQSSAAAESRARCRTNQSNLWRRLLRLLLLLLAAACLRRLLRLRCLVRRLLGQQRACVKLHRRADDDVERAGKRHQARRA